MVSRNEAARDFPEAGEDSHSPIVGRRRVLAGGAFLAAIIPRANSDRALASLAFKKVFTIARDGGYRAVAVTLLLSFRIVV